jgi:hypothetical protein
MEYTVALCCWEFCHRIFSFRQSHHLKKKNCTGPHIIAMHSNQHNFTYEIHTILFLGRCSRYQPFIIIILWLFHSLLTCRLVYNTNSYISMHYHHVMHLIIISIGIHIPTTLNVKIFKLEIDCIISIIIQIMLNIHRIDIHIGSYVLKVQVYH